MLFFHINDTINVKIRRRILTIERGYYLYVGSAFGTGGLSSRLSRHLKHEKKIFWHIDQLTTSEYCTIEGIGVAINQHIECMISQSLAKMNNLEPIIGFGNSDCKMSCPSHLYKFKDF
ncbi:MAG: GIY-YIG nuclease family protein [Candidatus Heimdallarchaeaceae archaeon]